MDYKAIFLNNDKVKEVVSKIEANVNVLAECKQEECLKRLIVSMADLEKILALDEEEKISGHLLQIPQIENVIQILLERVDLLNGLCEQFECKNRIDEQFCDFYKRILNLEGHEQGLYELMVQNFTKYFVAETERANDLLKSYNRTLYWGALDYWTGNYELIRNRAESLYHNADEMLWMYLSLEDYTSKEIMYRVLYNWVTFTHQTLHEMPRNQYDQYFDYDLISGSGGDVFIDAGACKGDTIDSFVSNFRHYMRIYSYEITPDTFKILQENAAKYDNVICRRCGISDKSGSMYVNICEDIGGNRLSSEGEIEVSVVTLDEDVKEKIDFIKMDIEGAEYNAIIGAKEHIKNEHPKLAIAAYHNNIDIFRLAQLIHTIDSGYRFYFRYYGGTLYPNDYVLYAI